MELAERPRDTRCRGYSRKCSTPSLSGDRRWNVLNCATARMYVSWVLGDKLRIVMSSIMRWRRGEIGLVIGGLLSVGLHERAILADRTPPTMIQLRLGGPTAKRNRGTKVSKPQKPPILDWSHQPHHRRLPRQRFSATKRYGMSRAGLLRLDVGGLDHLAPFLGFVGDELAKVCGRDDKQRAPQVGKACLDLRIGEARVDLPVELINDFGWCVLRRADA